MKNVIIKAIGATAFLLLISCSEDRGVDKQKFRHDSIKRNLTAVPSENLFPRQVPNAPGRDTILSAKILTDILIVDRVIKLQVNDESIVGQIGDMIYLNESFYILDALQTKILRFDNVGNFKGLIGRKGEGPGEYTSLLNIERCCGEKLALYDNIQGRIHVYDSEGNFIKSSSQLSADGTTKIIPQISFIWTEKDRLYLAAFPSLSQSAPWHVILDYSEQDYRILWGFGERDDLPKKNRLGSWAFLGLRKVGDTIWTGSPYKNTLDIFDQDGHFLGVIGKAKRVNPLTKEDLEKAVETKEKEAVRTLFAQKSHTFQIFQIGDFVFVKSLNRYDVYDLGGNLLKVGLERNNIRPIMDSFGDYAFSDIVPSDSMEYYNEEDFQKLKEAGFNLSNNENDNPYIRVGKLNR